MVKRFIQYYKPHKWLFLLDFSCAFFISIIDLISPIVAKNIIDNIIAPLNEILRKKQSKISNTRNYKRTTSYCRALLQVLL